MPILFSPSRGESPLGLDPDLLQNYRAKLDISLNFFLLMSVGKLSIQFQSRLILIHIKRNDTECDQNRITYTGILSLTGAGL